jgi:predicted 3-demethylubiquinone-9 3-methyltransferase (glyoxalase superfamily)
MDHRAPPGATRLLRYGCPATWRIFMQKITPFLWFDGQLEEAMAFYLSVFKNAKVLTTMPGPGGGLMSAHFQIEGQDFMALNGGPMFQFTPAISFFVSCETQDEVDHYWDKLLDGGQTQQCGWLKDRFGVSWQIVPTVLGKLLQGADRAKAGRAMQAMMGMVKLDIAGLLAVAEG